MAYLKELKVTYTRKRVKDDLLRKPVKEPQQVYELFKYMQDETKEKVICLHLNPQLEILSYEVVAIGTTTKSLIDAGEIYRGAVVVAASSIIIIHNHPLGNCKPSEDDKEVVKELVKAGELLQRPLQDFIIIGEDGFYSFERKGLL